MQKTHGDWKDEEVIRCDKIIRIQSPEIGGYDWSVEFRFSPHHNK